MDLNKIMEFDHVIRVDELGNVTEESFGVYAPSLRDDELDVPDWSLLDGYSGQSGYSGPIMHASEYIGGRLADDILSQPGYYVALVNYVPEDEDDPDAGDGYIEAGWAVAYRPLSD
mgnify:CR=1 FL=1